MKRFAQVALTTIGLMMVTGVVAQAQTPTQQWKACRDDAFWAAYDCFLDSTSYWGDVACNVEWDFDNTACDVALVKHVMPD